MTMERGITCDELPGASDEALAAERERLRTAVAAEAGPLAVAAARDDRHGIFFAGQRIHTLAGWCEAVCREQTLREMAAHDALITGRALP